jgi:NhaA family Na+:H+ antiporter
MPRYTISDRLQIIRLFREFFESEKTGGIVQLFCRVISLLFANSAFREGYSNLMHIPELN